MLLFQILAEETTQYFDHLFSPINTLDKKFSVIASKKFSIRKQKEKKIYTYKFNQIIQKYNIKIKQIDFINIDVEAHDLEVLEGIDLSLFNAKILCVEMTNNQNNIKEKKLRDYLNKYNYDLIKTDGLNGFFEFRD